MSSSARVKTNLQNGAQAKVTLEATAPGMTGRHSRAIVQLSGPSSSKVVVSASGAPRKKPTREAGTGKDKEKTSTLLLRGPTP